MLKMLERLVDSKEHSDVTLMVRDSGIVHAHQLLLATRCPTLYSVTCVCLQLGPAVPQWLK